MERRGKCLCGAVSYTASGSKDELSACHCGMCRRWTGGPLMCFSNDELSWEGEENIKTYKSSDWAERGFCSTCGTNLFYRVTTGKHEGATQVAFGTLEDPSGFTLTREWFIDQKPDCYTLAGEREKLTEAQVFAMFSGG